MKLLIVLICCLGALATDQQADSSEVQSTNKLTASKSSLNAIPSAPAQKTTLIQQSHQQYIPQYVVQKPVQHHSHSQQPAAMYIIAQPAGHPGHHQSGSQNTLFQQAVQQLLSYYNNNPQARYQLLQQQGGTVPQHQQITHAHPVPQATHHHQAPQQTIQAVVQSAQPSHTAYHHHPHMPSGALHVIPSPHLDNSNINHLPQPQAQVQTLQHQPQPQPQPQPQVHAQAQTQSAHQTSNTNQPQAIYAIPASSQYTLSQLSPGLLAQLTGHSTPQQQTVPLQLPQQYSSHHQQLLAQASAQPDISSQLSSHFGQNLGSQFTSQLQLGSHGPQFYAQLPASFGGQFQLPGHGHFALPSQFQNYQHLQLPGAQQQISGVQPQFSLKQNTASNGNEYVAQVVQAGQPAASAPQTEKNTQGQSSSYNPIYKTAYIKG